MLLTNLPETFIFKLKKSNSYRVRVDALFARTLRERCNGSPDLWSEELEAVKQSEH